MGPRAERRNPTTVARLAAGRARALGVATRGTTQPNRLRRMDRWIAHRLGASLAAHDNPLVVDLGYGATPVTTLELAARLGLVNDRVRVLGLELDGDRVAAARPSADPPRLDFARGGFELGGHRPQLVRAANVLRQYDEVAAATAWTTMRAGLAAGGMIVEGTSNEVGRLACWVLLDETGPLSLTLAAHTASLTRPSELAARLPKALIHHNVAGQTIHALLRDLDAAWATAAPLGAFGARQRWVAACLDVARSWPVLDRANRWRHGELTVRWDAVAPDHQRFARP